MKRREFLSLCSLTALAGVLTACTGSPDRPPVIAAPAPPPGPPTMRPSPTLLKAGGLVPPPVRGLGRIAPATPLGASPAAAPVQAGPGLVGHPLPTSQWWTSALVGELSLPMWAVPLALQVTTGGVALSGADPTVTADHIVTPFLTDITLGSAVSSLTVTGFGAFHVELSVDLATSTTLAITLVQGSPIVFVRSSGGPLELATGGTASPIIAGPVATVTVAGRVWVAAAGTSWAADGNLLHTASAGPVAIGLVPAGADPESWGSVVAASVSDPIIATTAAMNYDTNRSVTVQTLTMTRASGKFGPFVLLPHHQQAIVGNPPSIGSYQLAIGPASVVHASTVTLEYKSPDPIAPLPTIGLPAATKTAVLSAVRDDLADPPGGGGSYGDGKEMGRLATIAEVARVIGASAERTTALARLKVKLIDWLTYTGISDDKYFAYEPVWGGIVGIPNEYGSESYNDHHFHYGYHVRAAAILAETDPQFLADYGAVVDLLVADYAGSATIVGLPYQRVFQPYLGHSGASGLVPFADGNNQESSSEAIQAWHAMARWGAVRGNAAMVEQGRAHYAAETTTALLYWLGETAGVRPTGYEHTVAGIVWDSKVDFATWFSPMPEAIFGIQLIPLNEGSGYRANRGAAHIRATELRTLIGGPPRMWGDLLAADLALSDPSTARTLVAAGVPRELSTGRAITRYWVELLATRQ